MGRGKNHLLVHIKRDAGENGRKNKIERKRNNMNKSVTENTMMYFVVLVWSRRFYECIELVGCKTKKSAEKHLNTILEDNRGCLKKWGILKGELLNCDEHGWTKKCRVA